MDVSCYFVLENIYEVVVGLLYVDLVKAVLLGRLEDGLGISIITQHIIELEIQFSNLDHKSYIHIEIRSESIYKNRDGGDTQVSYRNITNEEVCTRKRKRKKTVIDIGLYVLEHWSQRRVLTLTLSCIYWHEDHHAPP